MRTAAGMAAVPKRFATLPNVVASVAAQVDHLYVYVNGGPDGMPSLSAHRNVTVEFSESGLGDLSARGKMYGTLFEENSLYLSLDDDFLYPPDYVERFHWIFEQLGNRVVVGVHAGVVPQGARGALERMSVQAAQHSLDAPTLVNFVGSGTAGFHTSVLDLTRVVAAPKVQVDLDISLAALAAGLPLIAIPRGSEWLRHLGHPGIWEETRNHITHRDLVVQGQDWSWPAYRDNVLQWMEHEGVTLRSLENLGFAGDEIAALEGGVPPAAWRLSPTSLRTRERHLRNLIAATCDLGQIP